MRRLRRGLRRRSGTPEIVDQPVPVSRVDPSVIAADGYQVVHLLDPASVARVRGVLTSLGLERNPGFFASAAHGSGSVARPAHLALAELLGPALAATAPGMRVIVASATMKDTSAPTEVKFHADWTYTDERTDRALLLWCPLVDAHPGNGGLAVVPGSHRWVAGIRASRSIDGGSVVEPHQEAIRARARALRVAAGDAIAFDPALLHGSGPNRSDGPRPAVTVATAREGADLVHFHEGPGGRVAGARVDADFFTTRPYAEAPDGYPPLGPWAPVVGEADYARALAAPFGR